MHEILRSLPEGAYVLDIGCAKGSFADGATRAKCVRLDREAMAKLAAGPAIVQADAALLPFATAAFSAVISNHSLEHFEHVAEALLEIGRVIEPGQGSLYIAVPDASTLTDRLYRWLGRGGGHVNAWTSAAELARRIEASTGLPHVATRTLCSSLSFLHRRNAPSPMPRRLLLLGGGHPWSLAAYVWISRRLERWLHWRTSVYGWAFYFGMVAEPIDRSTWVNVCVRCGSGCASALLSSGAVVRSFLGMRVYRCPSCATINPYAEDFEIEQ